MNRLLATMCTDVRLQYRNGFYFAIIFVLALCALIVTQLPDRDWRPWLAPIVFGNLVMGMFFFIGGLVLLEKQEGTLEAQVVTPLRVDEYLWSKVVTLAALSLAENLTVVMLFQGLQYQPLPLILGILSAAALYALFGFVVVARYDSINEYLMPSFMYVTLLSLPYLYYFGWLNNPLMFFHPMQGSLLIMKAAFLPVASGELVAGVASTLVWLVISYRWCTRSFHRFVVLKEGVR